MKSLLKKFKPVTGCLKLSLFNHIGIGLVVLLMTSALFSCKKNGGFLDQKTLSILDENAVFSDSLNTWQFILGRYNGVTTSWEPTRFGATVGGLESACDEAESATNLSAYSTVLTNGAANPSNADKAVYTVTYQQVRAVNIFLKNEAKLPVKQATKNVWEGQLRFLRAWYYSLMLKTYGGFSNVGNTIYNDGDKIDVPRSSYDDCVKYITSECDAAAALLPLAYSEPGDYGRATKGSALGLKARVLLYAASPLTNSARGDDPGHLVSYGSADNNRWQLAAKAAQDVIDLHVYSLYRTITPPFQSQFLVGLTNVSPNSEMVFAFEPYTVSANNQYRETLQNPASRGTKFQSSPPSVFPLQELVDAFGMANGLPITDPASGYPGIGNNMYLNRDPRFYYTVTYNGGLRARTGFSVDEPVFTYTGVVPSGIGVPAWQSDAATDGIYRTSGTKTGYFCFKMLNNQTINGGSELNRPRIMIRYAEILLDAAEAYNEFSGPSNQIYTWLQDIRNRAGIAPGANGLYGMKANMSKDEMRSFLQNERQVELAYEEHRFWDVRRWKIAPQTENKDMHGMEITRAADGSYSYRTIVVRSHVFRDNMYFFPIPQAEITKSPSLIQNPGY